MLINIKYKRLQSIPILEPNVSDFYCHWHVHKIIQEYIIFLDLIKYLIDVHCILNQPYSHKMLEAK
jgi:hypothetical protein